MADADDILNSPIGDVDPDKNYELSTDSLADLYRAYERQSEALIKAESGILILMAQMQNLLKVLADYGLDSRMLATMYHGNKKTNEVYLINE